MSFIHHFIKSFTCCVLFVSLTFSSQLCGYSFNENVQGRHLFSQFRYRGGHGGWGVAFYPDVSLQVFKGTKKATGCVLANFMVEYDRLKAPLLLAHVRGDGAGNDSFEAAQPFQRELKSKRYAFIHCGILTNYQQLDLERFKPIGETDSEHLFCHILGQIEKENVQAWTNTRFEWLQGILRSASSLGTLSCLLSDGEHLFAYQGGGAGESKLCYIQRKAPFGTVHFIDSNQDIDLSTVYPTSAQGYVLCSEPMTREQWTTVGTGQLVVFKAGKIVWEGTTPIQSGAEVTKGPLNLIHSFPNPFSHVTTVQFTLKNTAYTTIDICNARGEVVRRLVNGAVLAGAHVIPFDGRDKSNRQLGNGVYLLRIKTDTFVETRELILSR